MKKVPELVRYWGWDPTVREWGFLVMTNGWIDLCEYLQELRQWAKSAKLPYTCFAFTAWTRAQQDVIEQDAWRREAEHPGSVVYPIH